MAHPNSLDLPLAVILAGGLSRRMAEATPPALRPKGLIDLDGQTMLSRIAQRLGPQSGAIVLNANDDPALFAALGLEVISDSLPGHPGPLAGILAGMEYAADRGAKMILTAPSDTPFLPVDLTQRLMAAGAPAMAATRDETGIARQPTFALWPVALKDDLSAALHGGVRKLGQWADRHAPAQVVWDVHGAAPNPFFNINTPDDLAQARRALRG